MRQFGGVDFRRVVGQVVPVDLDGLHCSRGSALDNLLGSSVLPIDFTGLITALFDRPAFGSCISHGIVLGSDGQKMSKSLRNYPNVSEVFDRDGADAMRWFLMSSPILRGGNLIAEEGIRDGVCQVLMPLWNAYYFFTLYANVAQGGAGYDAKINFDSTDVLDRYLLAKLGRFVDTMTSELDELSIAAACDATRSFLEVLSDLAAGRQSRRSAGRGHARGRPAADRGGRGPRDYSLAIILARRWGLDDPSERARCPEQPVAPDQGGSGGRRRGDR